MICFLQEANDSGALVTARGRIYSSLAKTASRALGLLGSSDRFLKSPAARTIVAELETTNRILSGPIQGKLEFSHSPSGREMEVFVNFVGVKGVREGERPDNLNPGLANILAGILEGAIRRAEREGNLGSIRFVGNAVKNAGLAKLLAEWGFQFKNVLVQPGEDDAYFEEPEYKPRYELVIKLN